MNNIVESIAAHRDSVEVAGLFAPAEAPAAAWVLVVEED